MYLYVCICNIFYHFKGSFIAPLEVSELQTSYRVEYEDEIITDLSDILKNSTSKGLKDGQNHVFGSAEYTNDIPQTKNEKHAAFVTAKHVGVVEHIRQG